jgi:hypothetical protein
MNVSSYYKFSTMHASRGGIVIEVVMMFFYGLLFKIIVFKLL